MASSTAAGLSESAFVVNSFSKYFSMTGWRLGWLVVPTDLTRSLECLAQNLFIAPPTVSQHGGVAAFDCHKELDAHVERYAKNREILLSRLPEIGFDRFAPADGAFYIYANISMLSDNAEALCKRILHEAGVATTPGLDFDPLHGHQFVRFSFAGSLGRYGRGLQPPTGLARRVQDIDSARAREPAVKFRLRFARSLPPTAAWRRHAGCFVGLRW